MKKKIVGILVCMLLIAVPVLSVAGNVDDETNSYLDVFYNNKGLVIEGQRYEEKCKMPGGEAGGCWVYKYTVKNTGDSEKTFDRVIVEFPTQMGWISDRSGGSPVGWAPTVNRDDETVHWSAKHDGDTTLGPGGSVNNFVIKTVCWYQDEGGASAIPTEGKQDWWVFDGSLVLNCSNVTAEEVNPKLHNHGSGYNQDHPAHYSFDKDHTTYAKTTGGSDVNWIIYDFEVVRQTRIFKLFSRNDSEGYMNPAEIEIAVGENVDGPIDQVVGVFLLPPVASGEIVEIDLGEIIEKRYAQLSILSRYNNLGEIVDPEGAEFAEIEFCTYVKPVNHQPEQPVEPSGSTSGKPGTEYTYTTNSTDPDNDLLCYTWDWGDGESTDYGPYESGEVVEASHIWDKKGDYQVKVKSIDEYNIESEWSDPLSVTMPRNRAINPLLLRFLQQFPILIRYILGLQ